MDYANPSALVSTDWVADHLHDPHVCLLEVDVDTTAYGKKWEFKGHHWLTGQLDQPHSLALGKIGGESCGESGLADPAWPHQLSSRTSCNNWRRSASSRSRPTNVVS